MTDTVTVAYLGNFRHSFCTEVHVAASLEAMGHKVLRVQEDARQDPWDQALAAARQAHMFMWTRTWGAHPESARRALDTMRAEGIPTVSFHLDRYIGLDREAQIAQADPFWQTQHVFTADGGHADQFAAYGVNHHWLPPGVYDAECGVGRPSPKYPHPVVFVGTHPYPHDEWRPYRTQVIEGAQERFGNRFAVWPKNRQPLRGQDLANLYASCKVVIGDSCLSGDQAEVGHYWSDRIPETLGRGALLIHPWVPGLDDWYKTAEFSTGAGDEEVYANGDLLTYRLGDLDHLYHLVEWALNHPDYAAAIAKQGQDTVLGRDTYKHRMAAVLDTVGVDGWRDVPVPDVRHAVSWGRNGMRVASNRQGYWVRQGHPTDVETFKEVWSDDQYGLGQLSDKVRGKVVVDVGGNVGAFTTLASALGASHVHVWEPEPSNRRLLEANVGLHERGTVTVHAEAMTDTTGAVMVLAPGPGGVHGGGTHQVAVTRIDDPALATCSTVNVNDALRPLGPIGLLKLDCEGGEYAIVQAIDGDVLNQVEAIVGEWHGPVMPHLADRWPASGVGDFATQWSLFVMKLADHGHLELHGHPRAGGVFKWRRF